MSFPHCLNGNPEVTYAENKRSHRYGFEGHWRVEQPGRRREIPWGVCLERPPFPSPLAGEGQGEGDTTPLRLREGQGVKVGR